jgi:hypothetical protein
VRKFTKRAIVAVGAVLGLKPADPKWVSALVGIKGTFERTGAELAINVAVLVWFAGVLVILTGLGIKQYRHWGWTLGTAMFSLYGLCMLCLLYFLVSRANQRYVFGDGTVSAYNSWGQLMWSEDLTGLKYVTSFSARGGTAITLFWPERKRALTLFKSLESAINASE